MAFITLNPDDWKWLLLATSNVISLFAGIKINKLNAKKTGVETDSISLNDKIIVNKYNKEQYEELKKAFEELEQKFIELKRDFRKVELEKDEIQRKFNVFKNIKTDE